MSLLFSVRYQKGATFLVSPIVGKTVFKRATQRNKLKRRIRAIMRVWYDRVPGARTGHYLIYTKKATSTVTFAEIKESLTYDLKNFSNHSL